MDVVIALAGIAAAFGSGWFLWMDELERRHHELKRHGWLLLRRPRR